MASFGVIKINPDDKLFRLPKYDLILKTRSFPIHQPSLPNSSLLQQFVPAIEIYVLLPIFRTLKIPFINLIIILIDYIFNTIF